MMKWGEKWGTLTKRAASWGAGGSATDQVSISQVSVHVGPNKRSQAIAWHVMVASGAQGLSDWHRRLCTGQTDTWRHAHTQISKLVWFRLKVEWGWRQRVWNACIPTHTVMQGRFLEQMCRTLPPHTAVCRPWRINMWHYLINHKPPAGRSQCAAVRWCIGKSWEHSIMYWHQGWTTFFLSVFKNIFHFCFVKKKKISYSTWNSRCLERNIVCHWFGS